MFYQNTLNRTSVTASTSQLKADTPSHQSRRSVAGAMICHVRDRGDVTVGRIWGSSSRSARHVPFEAADDAEGVPKTCQAIEGERDG